MEFVFIDKRCSKWSYSEYWCEDLAVFIAEGGSLRAYTRLPGRPPLSAIYRWRRSIEDFEIVINFAFKDRESNRELDVFREKFKHFSIKK